MPVQVKTSSVVFGKTSIPLTEFTGLVEKHLCTVPETRDLEREGARVRAVDFSEPDLERFVRRVCKWGGYAGTAGRVINQNPSTKISEQFRSANSALEMNPPNVTGALHEINRIKHLGRPSFASKHLRFLRPEVCPILDSIISGILNYELNARGYGQLSMDCLRVAEVLQAVGVPNPMHREQGSWYAADVEMALFAHLKGLQGSTDWR
jgi:hypothetical protein